MLIVLPTFTSFFHSFCFHLSFSILSSLPFPLFLSLLSLLFLNFNCTRVFHLPHLSPSPIFHFPHLSPSPSFTFPLLTPSHFFLFPFFLPPLWSYFHPYNPDTPPNGNYIHPWWQLFKAGLALTLGVNLTHCFSLCVSIIKNLKKEISIKAKCMEKYF